MKRLTVQVLNEHGQVIFVGTPGLEDEYINIEQEFGRPSSLSVKVSDLSAVLEREKVESTTDTVSQILGGAADSKPLVAPKRRPRALAEPEEQMHASAPEMNDDGSERP